MKLNKQFILRIITVFISIYTMSISFAMFYWANLGSDPVSVLVQGINMTWNISFGSASTFVNLLLFMILVFFHRKLIGLSTIISVLLTGVFLNWNIDLLYYIAQPDTLNIGIRLFLPILASFINCASLGLYLSMNLGASAFDGVVLTITKKFNVSYKNSMYILNAIIFIIGVVLGGVWGYATIVSLVLSGVLFERFLKLFKGIFRKWNEEIENEVS